MNNIIKIIFVSLLIASNVHAGFGNLAKVLIEEAFIDEKLGQKVFLNNNDQVVKNNLLIAMDSFKDRRGRFKIERIKSLESVIKNSKDLDDLKQAIKLLEMDPGEVTPDMLVDLSNKLARLSSNYGFRKVGVISCLDCAADKVSDNVMYQLDRIEKISFNPVKSIFKKIFSRMSSKKDTINLINSKMNEQKLGRVSSLPPGDTEQLAFYVSIETLKDGAAKDLVPLKNAINKLYSDSRGNVDLFSEPDSFKMWKLPSMLDSLDDIKYYTGLIELMAQKKSKGLNINESLEEVLDDLIRKETNLNIKKDMIMTKKNLKKYLKCL